MFICFKNKTENDVIRSMRLASKQPTIEEIRQSFKSSEEINRLSSDQVEKNKKESKTESGKLDITPSENMRALMDEFRTSISSYRPLIDLSFSMIPAVKSELIFEQMYENSKKRLRLIDKDEQHEIFGITAMEYPQFRPQFSMISDLDKAEAALPGAILLSLVATFDSFISEIFRLMLKARSERIENSTKTMAIKDILAMKSFDDVISHIIDEEVESLMRGSHDDQIKYIESNFNIKIREGYDQWGEFIEIFERRNLAAHGNCIVNNQYIANCNKHGLKISPEEKNKRLLLNRRYLRRSTDILTDFGLLLMFVLWRKHFPESDDQACGCLNHMAFELIKDGRPGISARILEFALHKQSSKMKEITKRMMVINLANSYKKLKNEKKSIEIIRSIDWSASSDNFTLCIHAIEGDIEKFVELMPRVVQSGSIKKEDLREWPVFEWVRNEDAVRQKFLETFGEPLFQPSSQETNDIIDKTDSESQIKDDNAVLH